jgi:branched-chain amino acid transport system substrate-binding protein
MFGTIRRRRPLLVCGAAAAAALALAACSSSSSTASSTSTSAPASSAGASSSAGTASAAASGTTIKVGVITTLTGPQASSSTQAATVAPAWADWVNASGGIGGHPVSVTVLDDKGDPATAQSDYQKLAGAGVAAIIIGSDDTVSAYDSAAIAAGIPLIGGTSNLQDWYTKTGMFPTMTGVVSGVGAQVGVAARYGHAKGFANLYCAEIAACAQASPILVAATKAADIGYTGLAVSATAPSYTAQCLQLKQDKVDYAQLNFATAAAVRFVQNCQAQGYNPTWGSSEQAIGSSFASLPSLTVYGPAFAFPSVASAAPVATFRAVMGKYAAGSDWREGDASFTWQGLMAFEQAVSDGKVAPSAAVTAADVTAGLYDFKDETLGGLLANGLTYTKGKPVGEEFNPCYFIVGMKNGQTTAPAGLTPVCPSS